MAISDFSSLTLAAVQAALRAGDILRKGFGTKHEITNKPGRQNLVTEYDRASENCIIATIQEQFPTHSFLAEESGYTTPYQGEHIVWVIDPLDGTTNFVHHIPLFTISIAAYYQEQGLCGVIFQPLTQELFIVERGKGAYLNGVRLHTSQTKKIEEAVIITGLPYDTRATPLFNIEQLLQIIGQGATLRNLGSAALALAYIAAGKADAFWMYNLYPWDLAAGQLLIEEAGGVLSFYKNKPTLHSPTNVLASNPELHSFLKHCLE